MVINRSLLFVGSSADKGGSEFTARNPVNLALLEARRLFGEEALACAIHFGLRLSNATKRSTSGPVKRKRIYSMLSSGSLRVSNTDDRPSREVEHKDQLRQATVSR